jgi:hypothetical protein
LFEDFVRLDHRRAQLAHSVMSPEIDIPLSGSVLDCPKSIIEYVVCVYPVIVLFSQCVD